MDNDVCFPLNVPIELPVEYDTNPPEHAAANLVSIEKVILSVILPNELDAKKKSIRLVGYNYQAVYDCAGDYYEKEDDEDDSVWRTSRSWFEENILSLQPEEFQNRMKETLDMLERRFKMNDVLKRFNEAERAAGVGKNMSQKKH